MTLRRRCRRRRCTPNTSYHIGAHHKWCASSWNVRALMQSSSGTMTLIMPTSTRERRAEGGTDSATPSSSSSRRRQRSMRGRRQRSTLNRSPYLTHSARAATGAVATLPAHLHDVRGVAAATVVTRRRTTTTMTMTMTTADVAAANAEVDEAGDTVDAEVGDESPRGGTRGGRNS